MREAFKIVKDYCARTDLALISNDSIPYRWIKYADCLVVISITKVSLNVLKEAFWGTKIVCIDCSPTIKSLLPPEMISPVREIKGFASVMINTWGM